MKDLKRYKGCKIIIRDDESGRTIAETNIVDYNNKTQSISVDSRHFDKIAYDRISMLILQDSSVYEFKGNARNINGARYTEIALYQGHEKDEDRTTKRYDVNVAGRIENIIISKHICPLPHPLNVVVKNISADGVLMKAATGLLNIDTTFQLKLLIDSKETVINSTIIRIDNIGYNFAEYGCQFDFLYDANNV